MSIRSLKTTLSLDTAKCIADAALAAGRERQMTPLTVVILDQGGHLITMQREDGSGIVRFDIAQAKAYGALGMGLSSRALGAANTDRPAFLSALSDASGGRAVPVAGGVLICDADETVIGAVGVSGDNSDNDEHCAIAGIRAAGLASEPGA